MAESTVSNFTGLDATGVQITDKPAFVHSVFSGSGGSIIMNSDTKDTAKEVVRGGIRPQDFSTPIPCPDGIFVSSTSGTCNLNLQWSLREPGGIYKA